MNSTDNTPFNNFQNPDEPLVSIVVITYNSAKYVLETLESAKAQTYKNIELIISDDCSTDNTVEICNEWLLENGGNFINASMVNSSNNTGTTANCNRGLIAANGHWVKLIAGDDILFPHCIETCIETINKEKDCKILVSEIKDFTDYLDLGTMELQIGNYVNPEFKRLDNAKKQFIYFLKGFYIPGPGLFVKRKLLTELDGFDERYFLVEDLPLFLKYTFNEIKIYYIPFVLIGRRRHSFSVTSRSDKTLNPYVREAYDAIYLYTKFYNNTFLYLNAKWHIIFIKLIFATGNEGVFCNYINNLRIKFQPLRLYNLLAKFHIILPLSN